jgi:hypothetical protein
VCCIPAQQHHSTHSNMMQSMLIQAVQEAAFATLHVFDHMQHAICVLCCMQVRHETAVRLHVKISPVGVKRYEVPETLLPRCVRGFRLMHASGFSTCVLRVLGFGPQRDPGSATWC